MSKSTLDRVLVCRGSDGEMTRYEIFSNDGNPADNIEFVIVYREKDFDGNKLWVRTNDEVALDHLAPQQGMGLPSMGRTSMYSGHGRQISYVIDECEKHWSKHYE